jgi:ABC-type multidrug transport system permease subunit
VFWAFVFPVLLAFALGIAFRHSGPEVLPVAVEEGTPDAPALAAALSHAGTVRAAVLSPGDAAKALRTGDVALVVQAHGPQSLTYRFDPSRPESRLARLAVDDALQRAAGRTDVVLVRDETRTEPGARYIDFLIPGLIGLNLMGSGLWGVGFAVVTARAHKLLKQLAATPMKRWHYLASFVLSRLIFLGLEVMAILGFAMLMFGVRVRGAWLSLGLIVLLGTCSFAALGLLVASRPRTTEGVTGLMNLVMLPMWLLSGTFFSASRFPEFITPVVQALPLTALNDALRAVINEGAALLTILPELGVLLTWGIVSLIVALKIFRWQ